MHSLDDINSERIHKPFRSGSAVGSIYVLVVPLPVYSINELNFD